MHQSHHWNGSTYHSCHSYHSTTYHPDQDPTPRSKTFTVRCYGIRHNVETHPHHTNLIGNNFDLHLFSYTRLCRLFTCTCILCISMYTDFPCLGQSLEYCVIPGRHVTSSRIKITLYGVHTYACGYILEIQCSFSI